MNADASPFPHDGSYDAQALRIKVGTAARLDATNQMLRQHLERCQLCRMNAFGYCSEALQIIANPPQITPANN